MAKAKSKQAKKFCTDTYGETTRDELFEKAKEEIKRLDNLKDKLNETIDDYLYDDTNSPVGLIEDMIKSWEYDIDEKDLAIQTLDDLEEMVRAYIEENDFDKQKAIYEILEEGVNALYDLGYMENFGKKHSLLFSFLEKIKKLHKD